MTLPVDICNWALVRIGQPRINSIDPPYMDPYGVEPDCAFLYPLVRDAELRKYTWSFARARALIAADTGVPAFGTADDDQYTGPGSSWATPTVAPQINQFKVPFDFLRLIKTKYETRRLEGEFILTYEGGPLQLNYVRRPPPELFDPTFVKALSCKLAEELTTKITTSSSLKQLIAADYKAAITEARSTNAIEAPPERTPEDDFILVRR